MRWYAVHTKPHQERQAEVSLLKSGVEFFSPRIQQRKLIRRVRKVVIRPLFPGYLFARFSLTDQFRVVNYARGVRNIVTFGARPAEVDDQLVEALKERVRGGFASVRSHDFSFGQVVHIDEGPLQGFEAIFERELTDQQRVVLLLRTLAYQARVVIPLEQVCNI